MSDVSVSAPSGAHWEFDNVKTAKGTQDLGEVPILTWDDASAALNFYGNEGLCDILDGTSLRVAFQSIARRGKVGNKSNDDIAKSQTEYRPGKRTVGAATPASKARKAADAATAAGVDADKLTELLNKIAAGEITL